MLGQQVFSSTESVENFEAEADLALAVIGLAFEDLTDPTEVEDAFEFLTVTLWSDDPESLPYATLFPRLIDSPSAQGHFRRMVEDVRARRRPVPRSLRPAIYHSK